MLEFLAAQWDKVLTFLDLATTIASEAAFLVTWFLAQHVLRYGIVHGAMWLGPEYGERGHDYQMVMTAHTIGSYGMLGIVLILLVKDMCRLGLASQHEVYMLYKKNQAKAQSEGWKSSK